MNTSTSSTQHGRQQPQQQTTPPTDPRTRNNSRLTTHTSDSPGDIFCKDFIWGICSLGTQCIYRHELEFEAMKSVLKFCHNHQNKTGCTRPNCTYLHTSREEENLFLATGQIPRVLIDRYKAFSNSLTPLDMTPQPQPHHMIYENITQPPPPPPPPPTPATVGSALHHSPHNIEAPLLGPLAGPMQIVMTSPIQGSLTSPMQGPNASPIQAPMQGPMHGPAPMPAPMPPIPAVIPPPPPPPTSLVSSTRMTGPIYTAPLAVQQNMSSSYHSKVSQNALPQAAMPPLFDPTRPPPPIPQTTPNRVLKRTVDDIEVGPSKISKVDISNDTSCVSCVRRLIRIDQISHQIEQVEQEAEQTRSEVSLKMASCENKRQLLLNVFVRPETYQLAKDFLEDNPVSAFSSRNELFNSNIFSNPVSTSVNSHSNMMQRLLELFVGSSTRDSLDSMPSSSTSADPVDLLTARTRSNKSTPDILSSILSLLKNMPSTASSNASSESELSGNGFSRSLGEPPAPQRPHEPPPAAPLPPPYSDPGPPRYPPRYPPPPRHFPPPPPAPVDTPAPPRALFAHAHFPPNIMANPPYPGAVHNQPLRSPMPPQTAQNNPYSMGGRYPNQHYYPPYQ